MAFLYHFWLQKAFNSSVFRSPGLMPILNSSPERETQYCIETKAVTHLLSSKVRLLSWASTDCNWIGILPHWAYSESASSSHILWRCSMQLAEFGLIASALQLCVARHALAHIPRHDHTQSYVLPSGVGSTPEAVFAGSTKSLYFLEADVDIQYQKTYATISAARQSTETPLRKQYHTSLQPTNIVSHYHFPAVPSQWWTGQKGTNSTWRLGNHSFAVYRPTFHSIATPLTNVSLKPSNSRVSAKGTPKSYSSFSSSGSHGRRASRVAVIVIVLILTGAALSIWS